MNANKPQLTFSSEDVDIYVWEPGDMTRYTFVLVGVLNPRKGLPPMFTYLRDSGGSSMRLPEWLYDVHPGYITEKMKLNTYESEKVSEFLAILGQSPGRQVGGAA